MVDSRLQNTVIGKKFKLGRKLGSGAFGDIYMATN